MDKIKDILKAILLSLITESLIKKIVIMGLEKLAKSTKNEVDDKIVEEVKKALESK